MDMRKVAAKIAEGNPSWASASEIEAFFAHMRDRSVDVAERLDVMRPYVICDWDKANGWIQEAYEDAICELPDDDPRVAEYYDDYYGVGEDGMCASERRWTERHDG